MYTTVACAEEGETCLPAQHLHLQGQRVRSASEPCCTPCARTRLQAREVAARPVACPADLVGLGEGRKGHIDEVFGNVHRPARAQPAVTGCSVLLRAKLPQHDCDAHPQPFSFTTTFSSLRLAIATSTGREHCRLVYRIRHESHVRH